MLFVKWFQPQVFVNMRSSAVLHIRTGNAHASTLRPSSNVSRSNLFATCCWIAPVSPGIHKYPASGLLKPIFFVSVREYDK